MHNVSQQEIRVKMHNVSFNPYTFIIIDWRERQRGGFCFLSFNCSLYVLYCHASQGEHGKTLAVICSHQIYHLKSSFLFSKHVG